MVFSIFYSDFRTKFCFGKACKLQKTPRILASNEFTARRQESSFLGKFIENFKQECAQNKRLNENLAKFREEREKLEQTEALKKARAKFKSIEQEAVSKKFAIQKGLKNLTKGVSESPIGKLSKTAAGTIARHGEKIGNTVAYKKVSKTATKLCEELDTSTGSSLYKPPAVLRKRHEGLMDTKQIKENTEAKDVQVHKDSRFTEAWEKFKNNSKMLNSFLNWRDRFEMSDSLLSRASLAVKEKIVGVLSTDTSKTLSAICTVEPDFSEEKFLRMCKTDFIPNILEASIRGDETVLRDWCSLSAFNALCFFKQVKKEGGEVMCEILDIDDLELVTGNVLDEGPVLLVRFKTDQRLCITDKFGKVVMGDKDKATRVIHVWALRRDMNDFNPKSSWTVIETSCLSVSLAF